MTRWSRSPEGPTTHEGIVAEPGLSTEAHLIEVIRDLAIGGAGGLAIGDIATRFADRFGGE